MKYKHLKELRMCGPYFVQYAFIYVCFFYLFFGKLGFSGFWFFMFLYFGFQLLFFFYVLNSLAFLIMSDLITFLNFLLTLFRPLFTNLDNLSQSYECLFAENFKENHQKYPLCCHSKYVSSLQVFSKKMPFLLTKIQNVWNSLAKF